MNETEMNVSGQQHKTASHKKESNSGCLKKLIYGLIILVVSVAIAVGAVIFLMDAMGINRMDNNDLAEVEIPAGSSTQQIAAILEETGRIKNPFCFRVYSKLTKADGKYQLGSFNVSGDMSYSDIVTLLQTSTPRETVTVTIPEGFTVENIAAILEESNVCSSADFFDAIVNAEFDFDFVKAIPTAKDGEQYAGRIYRLEGYLFPDTYNFYTESTGKAAVERILENFDSKITATMRAEISANNMTLDEVLIGASIVQGEAPNKEDMPGVARIIHNRLEPDSGYPLLQCDSTQKYIRSILPTVGGIEVTSSAYDTYQRKGLPAGAINNPGLDAINAFIHPSDDEIISKCYFFANDPVTGETYYSKTFAEHESTCRKHKIGVYG